MRTEYVKYMKTGFVIIDLTDSKKTSRRDGHGDANRNSTDGQERDAESTPSRHSAGRFDYGQPGVRRLRGVTTPRTKFWRQFYANCVYANVFIDDLRIRVRNIGDSIEQEYQAYDSNEE